MSPSKKYSALPHPWAVAAEAAALPGERPWAEGAESSQADARERDLVLAAQDGDARAIRDLYDTYRHRIWTLVLFSTGDPLQAQDVLQTVFFKVFRGLRSFRFQSSLFTWIYRIARNECLSQRRRRGVRHVPLETIVGSRDEIDSGAVSSGIDAAAERDMALRQAVMRLPFRWREVIVLKYLEGLSYEEMSRALGCAPGTVASRLNRALSELAVRLRPPGARTRLKLDDED